MKKPLIFILFFELVCSIVFAVDGKNAVQIVTPETKNLTKTDASWITGSVRDKLKSNLQDYAGLKTVVDETNERALQALQAKSEGAAYDEDEIIEAGKMTTAQNVIFTTITYSGSKYTLSCSFTNLTTGEDKTAISTGRKTINELYDGTGNAADEVTLTLCEKLNIPLTGTQKYYLKFGSAELSVKEQYDLEKKNYENFNKQIEEIKNEIKLNSTSIDQAANANAAKLLAEQALIEEKQAAASKRMQDLEAQSAKIMEDQLKEAERSLEMKKMRDKLASDAARKASQVRKEIFESQSVIGQIKVIESKKRALTELRAECEKKVAEINAEYHKLGSEKSAEIMNAPYSISQLNEGVPVPEAVEYRRTKVEAELKKLDEEKRGQIATVEKIFGTQDKALYKEIEKDLNAIGKKHSVSSFGEELKVDYRSYNGSVAGWKGSIHLYSDQVLLYESEFLLSYKALTGKDVPSYSDEEKRRLYDEEVDMYSSLLLRGDPILNYELTYSITPRGNNHPSSYIIKIHDFTIKFTSTGKVIDRPQVSNTEIIRNMTPAYDIRTKSEAIRQGNYNHELGGGSMSGYSIGGGLHTSMAPAGFVSVKTGVAGIFSFCDVGITDIPDFTREVAKHDFLLYGVLGLGFNIRPMIFKHPPAFYVSAGGGFSVLYLKDGIEGFKMNSEGEYSLFTAATYPIVEVNVGLQQPLTNRFAVFVEGKGHYIFTGASSNDNLKLSVTAGISGIRLK